VRGCDEVGARLGDVVWMPAGERSLLIVREVILIAVRLVGRCDDDLRNKGAAPTRFEQRPGPLNVRLEGRDGISVCDSDDRLRGEVDDCPDRGVSECPFQSGLVAPVTADDSARGFEWC